MNAHPSVESVYHGGEKIFLAAIEHRLFGQGAGGDQAGDFALDHSFGVFGVFHLFADGDFEAGGDHAVQIGFDGVVRDAGHGDGVFAFGAGGEGDAEDAGDGAGVFVEAFVKVADAEEEDGIGILLLVLLVLPHGGGEGGGVLSVDGISGVGHGESIKARARCSNEGDGSRDNYCGTSSERPSFTPMGFDVTVTLAPSIPSRAAWRTMSPAASVERIATRLMPSSVLR